MCETWSKCSSDFKDKISGYKDFPVVRHFTPNHQGKGHGGIIAFVKDKIATKTFCIPSQSNNILWIFINFGPAKLLLAVVYFVPRNSTTENVKEPIFDILMQELAQIKTDHSPTRTYIVGDFNGRIADSVEDGSDVTIGNDVIIPGSIPTPRTSEDHIINIRGKELLAFCSAANFTIANGRIGKDKEIGNFTCLTSNGASVVDYLLIEADAVNSIHDFEVGENYQSDHFPLFFNICDVGIDFEPEHDSLFSNDNSIPPPQRIKWRTDYCDDFINNLSADSTSENLSNVLNLCNSGDFEVATHNLTNIIHSCADSMVIKPKPVRQKSDEPWFDDECRSSKRLMKAKLRIYRKNRNSDNLDIYKVCKTSFRDLTKDKKELYKKSQLLRLKNSISSNNSREFWNLLRANIAQQTYIAADKWFQYFSRLYSELFKDVPVPSDLPQFPHPEFEYILDREISTDEVSKVLRNLKSNKAPGIDGVPIECWKNAKDIAIILTAFFNSLYNGSCYPELWKTAIIVPIHKKGDLNNPTNYRGISLLPGLGKIIIGVLNNRLIQWAEINSFFIDSQNGYRHGRSTIDSIFTIYSVVKSSFYKKPRVFVYCAMVDFLKAYDSVPRELLYKKLLSYGISEKFVNYIKSMYNGVRARVRCESNRLSELFECPIGLRQGCILSASLFITYLNDIENFFIENGVGSFKLGVKRIIMQLFADDLALMDSTIGGLQRKLNLLSDYCTKWGLSINKLKTKIIRFKSGRIAHNEKWHIDGQSIEIVDKFDYLGLTLASSMSWCHAIDSRIVKAKKAMFLTFSRMKQFGRVPRKIMLKIFDTQIAPVLLYGCELWGLSDLTKVETVATKYYKILLSVPQNSSIDFARGELGRRSLKLSIYKRVLSYWFKLLTSDPNTSISNAYKTLYELAESNKECWALRVRQLLFSTGFGEVWFNQGVGDVKVFMYLFNQRICDMENQEWHDHVNHYGSLRSYRELKDLPSLEQYLDVDLPFKTIRLFTKLRGGFLPFEANAGRWIKPTVPYDKRLCTLCAMKVIENEAHVLFDCPVWALYRRQLQNSHAVFRSNSFKEVCSINNPSEIQVLVKFLEIVLFERSEMLEILTLP